MLSQKDFIRTFPVATKTDRDCEVPLLMEWIDRLGPIDSLLDIGCHYSEHYYARLIRPQVKLYDGVDVALDPPTAQVLDNYYLGNANKVSLQPHDVVICVSTIEHSGLSTYKDDYVAERMKLFARCVSLARKHLWISFPIGQEHVEEGQLAIITKEHYTQFLNMIPKSARVKARFLYSQGPQAGHPWQEHRKSEVAVKVPYMEFVGNCSIAVLEIDL
jgi:hypothetical protein